MRGICIGVHERDGDGLNALLHQEPTSRLRGAKVQRHITNTYLKRIDAPVGIKPSLKCWMELNEG